jgi:ComF family protein
LSIAQQGHRWLDEMFSGRCELCGCKIKYSKMLCAACKWDLPWLGHICRRCSVPISKHNQGLCGRCQSQPPYYDRVYSLFSYRQPVTGLIVALKFQHRLHLARLLGQLMIDDLLLRLDSMPDIILPVPLHPQRLRERGFNQAYELARFVSAELNVEISAAVERCRDGQPQIALSRKHRIKNIHGVFRVHDQGAMTKSHVLIIDDVMTTGATVNELARILKQAGAARVDVVTLARAGDIVE